MHHSAIVPGYALLPMIRSMNQPADISRPTPEETAIQLGAELARLEGRVLLRFKGEVSIGGQTVPYELVPAQGVLAKPSKWRKLSDDEQLALVRERASAEARDALQQAVLGFARRLVRMAE